MRFSRSEGFSLIEGVIALVIFTSGVLAVTQAFSSGLFISTDIEETTLAMTIASAKMEELKSTIFASLASSGPTPDVNFPNYNVSVTATGGEPKQVGVTVAWNGKNGQLSQSLTTLRANY